MRMIRCMVLQNVVFCMVGKIKLDITVKRSQLYDVDEMTRIAH
jgi:hypothetical protein